MSEHLQLFLAIVTLVTTWSGVMIAAQRIILTKCTRNLDNKIDFFKSTLDEKIEELKKIPKDYQAIERELLQLKADLPLSYVRKEDFVRFDVVINTKLDRLRDLIEGLREKKNGPEL